MEMVGNRSRVGALRAMPVAALLAEAQAAGLLVFAEGDRLVVRGRGNTEADLVATVLARKPELLRLVPVITPDERLHFEERAAIAEHDGGLSQMEAERLAFDEVLARKV